MAWDFSTEPEFEEKLVWMRRFVREEIEPLETLDLDYDDRSAAISDPLKEQVQAQGLWAAHLPEELGGGGFGQVKLGLMHEILGRCIYAPSIFGNNAPDSRQQPSCSPKAAPRSRRSGGCARCSRARSAPPSR